MPDSAAPIRPLAEHLINQIAAGEVIERPASIVKELVENSIDAGAAVIDVELVAGGVEAITVTDDGCGIRGAELPAALRRHWTSKLSTADGLDAITSLGFRGEALASISAVADVDIVSRRHGDAHAWRLQVAAASDPGRAEPARGNAGCRIEVRALFHHVPARRRFLKQPRTEFLHVQRLVRQLAFARPDIAFSLKQADTRSLRLRPAVYGAPAPRWQGLFGSHFCQAAEAVDVEIEGIRVQGWIGGPELAAQQSDLQFIALNGRVIRDRNLQHAVRSAYGETIAPGRFPAYALALTVEPGAVDVNVHPGKLEVRFVALRAVHDVLHAAVRRALGAGALTEPGADVGAGPSAPLRESAPAYAGGRGRAGAAAAAGSASSATAAAAAVAWGRPLALIDGRFLLSARDEAVFGFDLRAAWDVVLQRRLATAGARARPLLLPVRLPAEMAVAVVGHPGLSELGFDFDDLGPAGAVMRAVPAILPTLDHGCFVEGLAAALSEAIAVRRAVAGAAAGAIAYGAHGRPSSPMLAEFAAAAAAADVAPEAIMRRITAAALAQALGNG